MSAGSPPPDPYAVPPGVDDYHHPLVPPSLPLTAPQGGPSVPSNHPAAPLVDPADARATLEARRELGAEMEQALVDSFTARVEEALVARIASEEAERVRQHELATAESKNQMVLGIVSLSLAIPLTAIFAGISGIVGGLVVWIGIVLVNMAYALRKGRR
ncbi:hypothetical protein [Raineyella sp. LH-20]|uniref:hypothetical protein n=1 Tax=Raineyella sp. LH-20 TaxID=3081204 RepID=UPI0029542FAA|nr:hypothetical protein [Raineyella sp. LH-20]WOP20129.1 hypothetical protein R0146_07585 [Raineyella sp. LH-20]